MIVSAAQGGRQVSAGAGVKWRVISTMCRDTRCFARKAVQLAFIQLAIICSAAKAAFTQVQQICSG